MMRLFALAAILAGLAGPLAAQPAWPSRPLRLIVPYGPGGSSDTLARLVQPRLAATLGQPVVVENRSGAGSLVGTEMVARSAPDGHTLLLADNALAVLPGITPRMPYDTEADLAPVALLGVAPLVFIARAGLAATTIAEFRALAPTRPEGMTFGAAGASGHITGVLIQNATGVALTRIAYRGAAASLVDLVAGTLDTGTATLLVVRPAVAAGQVRALAILGQRQIAALPGVQTMREQGIDLATELWQGVLVPTGTPQPVIAQLSAVLTEAVAAPEIAERLAALAIEPRPGGPEAFGALLRADLTRFTATARAHGIRVE